MPFPVERALLSRFRSTPSWTPWALAGAMLTPFISGAIGIWMLPSGAGQTLADWWLASSDLLLVGAMGGLRIAGARRYARLGLGRTVLAALPTICSVLILATAPMIGFRWTFALLMGALAGQGIWDFAGARMPVVLKTIRPVVTAGALVAMLVGFIGN